ncbi:MAG TPA: IS200/IS605 family transposase [Gemmataceae bacterium]|nr:IS200/IS605 family transposase [Gemmataceae bacterium]
MPQSFAAVLVHVVFSTKNRAPLITPELAPKLYGYIHGIIAAGSGTLLIAGGVADHVHLLVALGRETSIADLVRLVKSNSSGWVHETFPVLRDFAWQSGYGAFSVSRSERDRVTKYIETQAEHHKTLSFQDEFRELLCRHELEWDERYVWD